MALYSLIVLMCRKETTHSLGVMMRRQRRQRRSRAHPSCLWEGDQDQGSLDYYLSSDCTELLSTCCTDALCTSCKAVLKWKCLDLSIWCYPILSMSA